MARATPADDRRNASDHVDANFTTHNGKWYPPGRGGGRPQGRPMSRDEAITVTQACQVLGVAVEGEAPSTLLLELATQIAALTARVAALEAQP